MLNVGKRLTKLFQRVCVWWNSSCPGVLRDVICVYTAFQTVFLWPSYLNVNLAAYNILGLDFLSCSFLKMLFHYYLTLYVVLRRLAFVIIWSFYLEALCSFSTSLKSNSFIGYVLELIVPDQTTPVHNNNSGHRLFLESFLGL